MTSDIRPRKLSGAITSHPTHDMDTTKKKYRIQRVEGPPSNLTASQWGQRRRDHPLGTYIVTDEAWYGLLYATGAKVEWFVCYDQYADPDELFHRLLTIHARAARIARHRRDRTLLEGGIK